MSMMAVCGTLLLSILAHVAQAQPGEPTMGETEHVTYDAAVRYKHIKPEVPIKDEDQETALAMSEDLKCEACKEVLKSLLRKAKSFTEDDLLDLLEGDSDEDRVAAAKSAHERQVELRRKGCNKHFKDELLLQGWDVKQCMHFPTGTDPKTDEGAPGYCVWKADKQPAESDTDVYRIEAESMYQACEATVGKYTDKIAPFMAKELKKGTVVDDVVRDACMKKAKCQKRMHSMSYEERKGRMEEMRVKQRKKMEDDVIAYNKDPEKAGKYGPAMMPPKDFPIKTDPAAAQKISTGVKGLEL